MALNTNIFRHAYGPNKGKLATTESAKGGATPPTPAPAAPTTPEPKTLEPFGQQLGGVTTGGQDVYGLTGMADPNIQRIGNTFTNRGFTESGALAGGMTQAQQDTIMAGNKAGLYGLAVPPGGMGQLAGPGETTPATNLADMDRGLTAGSATYDTGGGIAGSALPGGGIGGMFNTLGQNLVGRARSALGQTYENNPGMGRMPLEGARYEAGPWAGSAPLKAGAEFLGNLASPGGGFDRAVQHMTEIRDPATGAVHANIGNPYATQGIGTQPVDMSGYRGYSDTGARLSPDLSTIGAHTEATSLLDRPDLAPPSTPTPPGAQAAGEEVAKKVFPLSGMPAEMAQNYMAMINDQMLLSRDPNRMGEQTFSNWWNNAQQLVGQQPGLNRVTTTQKGRTFTSPAGRTYNLPTKETVVEDPLGTMRTLAGMQAEAYKRGDAQTAQAAQQMGSLLLGEMQAQARLDEQAVANMKPTSGQSAADRMMQDAFKESLKYLYTDEGTNPEMSAVARGIVGGAGIPFGEGMTDFRKQREEKKARQEK